MLSGQPYMGAPHELKEGVENLRAFLSASFKEHIHDENETSFSIDTLVIK